MKDDWKIKAKEEQLLSKRLKDLCHTHLGGTERQYDVRIILYPAKGD